MFFPVQERDLYDPRTQWASFVINALKAKELQSRDVNYIVRDEEVRRPHTAGIPTRVYVSLPWCPRISP